MTQFVEGFAPKYLEKGKGAYTTDLDGNKYIDGMAGLFLKNIGHRWPEISQAVSEQMDALTYVNSGAYGTVPGILAAKKLNPKATKEELVKIVLKTM